MSALPMNKGVDFARVLSALGQGLMGAGQQGWGAFGPGVMQGAAFYDQGIDRERQRELDALTEELRRQQLEDARTANTDRAEAKRRQQEWIDSLGPGPMAPNNGRPGGMAPQPGPMAGDWSPEQLAYFRANPDAAAEIVGAKMFPQADAPDWEIKTIRVGDRDVTYRINPDTGEREELGAGAAFAPQAPQQPQDNVSLTPFYTTDAQGNVQMWQPSRSGVPVQVQLPEGINPAKPLSFQDLGTSVVGVQPLGGQSQVVLPKDVAGEAEQKFTGKAQGEAIEAYRSMSSKMPGLETVIAKLDELSDKATYTVGGQFLDKAMKEAGMEPRDAAIARSEYISIVDNQVLPLLRDTFGAAFTQKEGESLRATLGDPNASPKEKQAILRSFIEQKRRDIEALALRAAGGGETPSSEAPSIPQKRIKVDAEGNVIP